jgi:preprotein translocase subunit SecD
MITGRHPFNIYLLLSFALAAGSGCRTGKGGSHRKEIATLRVHIEVVAQSMDFSTSVPIYRQKPTMVTVDKSPFLTEVNVSEARVVDVAGGFDLQIKLERQGSWLFEQYTTVNPGKHIAIFSAFQHQGKKEARWLAAPIIRQRISSGVLSFTPDATREEAEEIASGLNNVAKKNKEDSKW